MTNSTDSKMEKCHKCGAIYVSGTYHECPTTSSIIKRMAEAEKPLHVRMAEAEKPLHVRMAEAEKPLHVRGTLATFEILRRSTYQITYALNSLKSVVAENPSLSVNVSPTIDWMKNGGEKIIPNQQERLLTTNKSEIDNYEKIVQNYENLIFNPKIKESEIQDF